MGRQIRSLPILLVLTILAVMWGTIAPAQVNVRDQIAPGSPPLIGPFRGTAGGYPESSLAGMAEALRIGAGIIDIQIQITADGQHVVFHDQFLNRMTDVEDVFAHGAPSGPTRDERAGRDYLSDYTLAEIRQLHLLVDEAPSEHGIPTLAEALDLVGVDRLGLLSLNDFNLEALVAELSDRPTEHLLVYNVNPEILQEVVNATGLPAFISLRRSRVFDTSDSVAILDAQFEMLGDSIALAHIASSRGVTPDLLARTQELGIRLSVSGGRENFALEEGDTGPWQETLGMDAAIFWTTYPEQVLEILNR